MNKLFDLVKAGTCKTSDFDTDPRFIKLCGILGRVDTQKEVAMDLKIVLGVTMDDQAAELINSIQLPQMVKVRA